MFPVPFHERTKINLWWREYFDLNCVRRASLYLTAGSALFWETVDLVSDQSWSFEYCIFTLSWISLEVTVVTGLYYLALNFQCKYPPQFPVRVSQKHFYSCCCFLMPHRFFTHWFLKIHYSFSPVNWVMFENDVLDEYLVDFKNLPSRCNSEG